MNMNVLNDRPWGFLVNKKRRCIKTKFFVINNKARNGIGSVEQ